jgi:hypothetical protein
VFALISAAPGLSAYRVELAVGFVVLMRWRTFEV